MKKIALSIVALLLYVTVALFAAVTDNFTAANGTLLTAHATSSASWTIAEGASSWEIQTNKASIVTPFFRQAMSLSDSAFPDDQYAQAVFKTGDSADIYAYVAVRMTGDTYYFVRLLSVAETPNAQLYKRSSGGAPTFLAGAAHGIADNTDCTVKLVVTSNDLEVFVNGVSKVTYTDASSPITSGRPGFGGLWDNAGTKKVIDDFESTSASAGATQHFGPFFGMGHF